MKRAGDDLLDEAVVEHEGIKWRIDLLKKMKPADDLYDAEVKVLAEYVRHHVKEEERSSSRNWAGATSTTRASVSVSQPGKRS